ncbi:MAG TPA: hypothetical protein VF753_07305 [Terriglobales bacterium]
MKKAFTNTSFSGGHGFSRADKPSPNAALAAAGFCRKFWNAMSTKIFSGGHGFSQGNALSKAAFGWRSALALRLGAFSSFAALAAEGKKFRLWKYLPITLLISASAFAQNCALCYTQAASSGQRMIEALRSGILILIVPPTLMSIGMIFVVHHKRNQFRQPDYTAAAPKDGEWQQLP